MSTSGEQAQRRQKAAQLCSVPAELKGMTMLLHSRPPCTRVAWYSCLHTRPSCSLQRVGRRQLLASVGGQGGERQAVSGGGTGGGARSLFALRQEACDGHPAVRGQHAASRPPRLALPWRHRCPRRWIWLFSPGAIFLGQHRASAG